MAKKKSNKKKKKNVKSTAQIKKRKNTSSSSKKKVNIKKSTTQRKSTNKSTTTKSGKTPKKSEQVKTKVTTTSKTKEKVQAKTPKQEVKKKRLRNYWVEIILVLIIIFALVVVISGKKPEENVQQPQDTQDEVDKNNTNTEAIYEECMASTLEDDENIKQYKKELINQLSVDGLAFAYRDLETGYYIANNDTVSYYAASTIKLLDGLYIYTKARANEIDLEDTITYQGYVRYGDKTYTSGTKMTLRKAVELAVVISDNAAHLALVDYIGFDNLKKFGNSLGATTTLVGGDKYGNINAKDATLYLQALDEFLQVDDEYSKELYDYFLRADANFYEVTDDDFIHKYGHYSHYYNDLGIVYGDKNYSIVFLSNFGNGKYADRFRQYYEIVDNFEIRYNAYKETYCYRKANEK